MRGLQLNMVIVCLLVTTMSLHDPVSNAWHIEGDIDGAGCFFVAKSPL